MAGGLRQLSWAWEGCDWRGFQTCLMLLFFLLGGRTQSFPWRLPSVLVKKAATVGSRCAGVEKKPQLGTRVPPLPQHPPS